MRDHQSQESHPAGGLCPDPVATEGPCVQLQSRVKEGEPLKIMASDGGTKTIRQDKSWAVWLLTVALYGCGESDSSAPIMVEAKHTHYHVHAVDASHEHTHGDGAVGGHAHSHQHSE